MSFWDIAYGSAEYKYGKQPNAFLAREITRLRPGGRILVPGDGEGRNGVWLAAQGFDVTTVDASAVGVTKARALAAESGVSMQAVHADLTQWQPDVAAFDAVVSIFFHLPPAIRPDIHRMLASALGPGGLFVLEGFTPAQLANTSGGPKDPAMLYSAELLRADLVGGAGLRELSAWEGTDVLDEGPGHQGTAALLRFIAQRP